MTNPFIEDGVMNSIVYKTVTDPQLACKYITEYFIAKGDEPMSRFSPEPTHNETLVESITWGKYTGKASVYYLFGAFIIHQIVNDDYKVDGPKELDMFCTHFDAIFEKFYYADIGMIWTSFTGDSMRDLIHNLVLFTHNEGEEMPADVQQIMIDANICDADDFKYE